MKLNFVLFLFQIALNSSKFGVSISLCLLKYCRRMSKYCTGFIEPEMLQEEQTIIWREKLTNSRFYIASTRLSKVSIFERNPIFKLSCLCLLTRPGKKGYILHNRCPEGVRAGKGFWTNLTRLMQIW